MRIIQEPVNGLAFTVYSALLVYQLLKVLYNSCHIHPFIHTYSIYALMAEAAVADLLFRSDTVLPIQSEPQYFH